MVFGPEMQRPKKGNGKGKKKPQARSLAAALRNFTISKILILVLFSSPRDGVAPWHEQVWGRLGERNDNRSCRSTFPPPLMGRLPFKIYWMRCLTVFRGISINGTKSNKNRYANAAMWMTHAPISLARHPEPAGLHGFGTEM